MGKGGILKQAAGQGPRKSLVGCMGNAPAGVGVGEGGGWNPPDAAEF